MNYKKKYLKYKNKYLNLVLYGGMELVTPKYTIAAMTNTILSSDSHDILPIIDTYKEIKVHPVISLPTDVEIQNQEYLLYIQQYDFDNINNICENFYNVYNKYSTVVTFRRYIYYCKTIKIKENKNKNHKNNFDVYLSDHIPVVYYKDQTMYFTFNVQIDNFDKFDHNKSWLYDTLEKKIFYYYIKALNICKLIYNKEKEYDTITNIIITLQECMYPLYIIISKILSIIFKSINHSFVFQNIEKNEYEYSGNYKTYKFTRLYKNIEIVDEYGFTINNTYYTDVDGGFANFTTYKNCTVSKPMLIYDKNVNAFTNDNSHKNQQTSSDISPTNKILKGSLYRSCRSCIFTINNEHQKITVINVHLTKTFGLDDLHIIINNKSSEYFKNYHNSTNSILRTYYDTYFDTTYDEYFDTDSILVVMGDFNMLFTIENKNPIILSKFIYNELYNLTYADSTVDWILYFDPINKSNEKLEGINNEDLLDLHEVQSDLHEYQPDLHEYQPDLHEDQQELDENQQELDEDQQELDEDQQELDEDQQELDEDQQELDEDQQELDEDQQELDEDQQELDEDQQELDEDQQELDEDQQELDEDQQELDEDQQELDEDQQELDEDQQELDEDQQELDEDQQELDEDQQELDEDQQELDEDQQELDEDQQELDEDQQELDEDQQELDEDQQELDEDQQELDEDQQELDEDQQELDEDQQELDEDQQELDEDQQELDEDQQELDEDQQELDEDQQELEQIDINKYIDEDQQELDEDQPDLHKDQSDLPEDINDIESLSTILHEDLDEEILEIQNKYNKILEIQNEITKYNNLNKILELNLANDTLKLPVIKSQLKKITANIHLYESYLQISSNRATPQVTLDITALRNNNLNYITKRDKLTTNIANNTKRLETNMATIIELKQRLDTLKTELDIQKTELAKKIIHNDTYKLEIELYELEAKLKDTNNNILSIESRKQHIENVIKSQNTNLETHQKNYDEELKKYNLSSKFKIDPELLKDLEEADYKTHLESGHVIHILRYIITKRQIVTNNKEYQLILNKLLLLGNTSRNKRDLEIINSEIKLVTNLIKNLKNQITEIDTKIEELKNISEELKEQIVNLKTTK